jgi:hypothetical protein
VLFDRHGHKLSRYKETLRPVFVQFLLANRRTDNTIGKELTAVSKQLGRDWFHTT